MILASTVHVRIINQYFPPDRSATALLLGQLAQDLSREFEVSIFCGEPTYSPDPSQDFIDSQIRTFRTKMFGGSRTSMISRIFNYFSFFVGALYFILRKPRADVVICWTDPPFASVLGAISKIKDRCKFILVYQDVYPEIAVAAQKVRSKSVLKVVDFILRWATRYTDAIVTVGFDMASHLREKKKLTKGITVIPNWQDEKKLTERPKENWRLRNDIPIDSFVVMHSGNLGVSQDIETLLSAAKQLVDETNILFVLLGEGTKRKTIEQQISKEALHNVKLFSYEDTSTLAESLSAADIHYVSLLAPFQGLIMPSKIYGVLAVGRPFILNAPKGCDLETISATSGAGFNVGPTPSKIAELILQVSKKPDSLQMMGHAGRQWLEKHNGRSNSTSKYTRIIHEVTR